MSRLRASRQDSSAGVRESERTSLALSPALEALPKRDDAAVLDLGPTSGANVRFFGSRSRVYSIVHYHDQLRAGPTTGSGAARRVLSIVDRAPVERYDLVLAWDLFNYLRPEELGELNAALNDRLGIGGLIFALIYYTADMPMSPCRFDIRGLGQVSCCDSSAGRRQSPRYKEPDLLRCLPGYEVERVFLLRHGVEEYLLTRGG